MNTYPITSGMKFKITSLSGKDAEEFKIGDIITFIKQTKAFGKIYWQVEESNRKLEIGKTTHNTKEVIFTITG